MTNALLMILGLAFYGCIVWAYVWALCLILQKVKGVIWKIAVVTAILLATAALVYFVPYQSWQRSRKWMDEMRCGKNLHQFTFQMECYGFPQGFSEDAMVRMAGLLIADTNFNRQFGFYKDVNERSIREYGYIKWPSGESRWDCWNWRYSRDGLFATCPAAPKNERLSYAGWPTTNMALAPGMPLLWEKGPYHDGHRHVCCYSNGHLDWGTLMTDAEFHALTNSFAKNALPLQASKP